MATDVAVALVLSLVLPVLAAWIVSRFVLARWARRIAAQEGRPAAGTMPHAVRLPVMVIGGLAALYLAVLTLESSSVAALQRVNWDLAQLWLKALITLTVFFIVYRVLLFGLRLATHGVEASSAILIRKVLAAFFAGVALITVLNQFNVEIGPVLASLGVAGLAVALALQDTLSNYFAGITLAVDRPIRVGDFIRLEDGQEGFVESLGWRSSRIKPWDERTIIIPNSKLASSVLTNNYYPDLAIRVYVHTSVSYASDLDHVERVCVEVGKEVTERTEGGDTDFEPFVRFQGFGESNIDLMLVLRAQDFRNSFLLRHEAIKALHRRFREEGIVIEYPVRRLAGAVQVQSEPPGIGKEGA